MSDLLHTLLRILAFTADRNVSVTVVPDLSAIHAQFNSKERAEDAFKTFKSAVMTVQGAPFAGITLEDTLLEIQPAAFAPFEGALRRMRTDMENLYLLSLAVLEPRFAASPVHRVIITRSRERRHMMLNVRFADTVSHVLLGNWLNVHEFGDDITVSLAGQQGLVQFKMNDEVSERLEAAMMGVMLQSMSFHLAMGQGLRLVSSNWFDSRLESDSIVLEVAGTASDELADGVVVLSDMAKLYDYLTLEMGASPTRDFRYEAVNDEKTVYGVILRWELVQTLRDDWLNQLYLEYLLSQSPALGYFERFRIERTRHYGEDSDHACYAISSHEPSAIMLAHAFLRKELGLDVGENYFEENGRYWIEVDEDDLASNLSFYKSAHMYLPWFSPMLRTLWSIPGISRVRMKKGWLRIRCDQPTFQKLSQLEGAVVPRITPSGNTQRGFGYRIFFSPWSLHRHATAFATLAGENAPPPPHLTVVPKRSAA